VSSSSKTAAIGLGLEMPTSLLGTLSPLTDLDFILAHRVLSEKAYAEWFSLPRHPKTEAILDNSMHEVGEPLMPHDLVEAAAIVKPTYVVAPDRMGETVWNKEQLNKLERLAAGKFKLAVVVTGKTVAERKWFHYATSAADLVCYPYREARRFEWFLEHPPIGRRIHLLGVSELPELKRWVDASEREGFVTTVDTGKPIKMGYLGKELEKVASLRHSAITSRQLLDLPVPADVVLRMIVRNIFTLRLLLGHEASA
jgi:hypothetical protein